MKRGAFGKFFDLFAYGGMAFFIFCPLVIIAYAAIKDHVADKNNEPVPMHEDIERYVFPDDGIVCYKHRVGGFDCEPDYMKGY